MYTIGEGADITNVTGDAISYGSDVDFCLDDSGDNVRVILTALQHQWDRLFVNVRQLHHVLTRGS